jgi:hypothetical protein
MMHESWAVLFLVSICLLLLLVAAGAHFYWGFGGQVAKDIAVPQRKDGTPLFDPSPLATHAVGFVLLAIIAAVILSLWPALLPIPQVLTKIAVAFFALVFLARALSWHRYVGFFKSVRTTRFGTYDTWLYSPICMAIGIGLLAVFLKP